MPRVGLAVVALFMLSSMPVGAQGSVYDECAHSLDAPRPCLSVSTPSDAPQKTFYLWVAAYQCAPTFGGTCSGRPTQGSPPLGFIGVLYEESNGVLGLQRQNTWPAGKLTPPDKALLL